MFNVNATSLPGLPPARLSLCGFKSRGIGTSYVPNLRDFIGLDPIIRHLHIFHDAPYLPPKILHKHCFNFSWDGCNTQEKGGK